MHEIDFVRPRHRTRDNRASDNQDWRKIARLYAEGYAGDIDDDFDTEVTSDC
jgi:hypothetical protein